MLNEMTWQEAKEMISHEVIAIIPAGSNEQHGPHLWLQEDTALALILARKAAEKFSPKLWLRLPLPSGSAWATFPVWRRP
jgi:creatinine amidohydrolase/Fe(II)-dependent formamide hydrolase-like protein